MYVDYLKSRCVCFKKENAKYYICCLKMHNQIPYFEKWKCSNLIKWKSSINSQPASSPISTNRPWRHSTPDITSASSKYGKLIPLRPPISMLGYSQGKPNYIIEPSAACSNGINLAGCKTNWGFLFGLWYFTVTPKALIFTIW
jgi:hypothetical protein